MEKRGNNTIDFLLRNVPIIFLRISFNAYKIMQMIIVFFVIFSLISFVSIGFGSGQINGLTLPITYYYTNPLYFTDYGYINSIIEPFYYMGYGYKIPITGNTLLAWNRYTPFHDAYSSYLFNFFEIPTYTFYGSKYQTTFPYKTLPGTSYPYARFQYPAYFYGTVDAYQNWLALQ